MANDGVGVDVKGLARGPTRGASSRDLIHSIRVQLTYQWPNCNK